MPTNTDAFVLLSTLTGSLNVKVSWDKDSAPTTKKDGEGTMSTFALKNGDELTAPASGMIRIAVTDTGAGMSSEQLAKLFRDGVQFNVNELQKGQGSGIGLYISKGIMKQHDGTLIATSPGLGLGTTFTMSLPLFHVPDAVLGREIVSEESIGSSKFTASQIEAMCLKVLIVDDAATNRKLLRRLLTNHGHTCDEAENGQVAITMVKDAMKSGTPYETILMDYEMPVVNGPQASQQLRSMGCDSFIVGITGNVMSEDVHLFKASGANAVLPKPFRLADLDQLWVEYGVSGNAIHSESELQTKGEDATDEAC